MTSVLARSCIICRTPLDGALGAVGRLVGIRRSSQNPNLCSRCDVHVQDGEIAEMAVLFADLTAFTRLTRELGPERAHEVVDAFLRRAKESVVKWDGFVAQFAGDEIMALFNVPVRRPDYRRAAVAAARDLQSAMAKLSERFGMQLQTTIGVAAGHARIGRLGSDDTKDYTAIGDVVNRAARLVAHVEPGGILVDRPIHDEVQSEFPDAPIERLVFKGFADPVEVVSLRGGRVLASSAPSDATSSRPLRAAMLLSAMLGAPCAGLLVLNPLLAAFGLGAVSFGAAGALLDSALVRLPLLALASGIAVAGLVSIVRGQRRSSHGAESAALPGRGPLGAGAALALVALSVVALEFVAHAMMH